MTQDETISKRLQFLRKSKGLSQKEVADYLGITRSGYANYEQGKRSVSFETALKLGELFDVSLDSIGYTAKNESLVELVNDVPNINKFELSNHEKEMVMAYRQSAKNMRDGIDRMLGIEPEVTEQEAKKIV